MSHMTIAPVRYSVTVPIPADRAFTLFTEGFNTWWIGHHIGQADLAEAVLEPREGGRWYERDVDGRRRIAPRLAASAPPQVIACLAGYGHRIVQCLFSAYPPAWRFMTNDQGPERRCRDQALDLLLRV